MQVPVSIPGTPEGMLFINPYTLFFILLYNAMWVVGLISWNGQTFHLVPKRRRDSISCSLAFGNNWPYTMVFSNQFQSFLVTSETNQGYRLPWKRTCLARPLCSKKSAGYELLMSKSSAGRAPQTIDHVTIQLEACIVKYKINSATCFLSQIFDSRPKTIQIITQNVLLGCCQVITSCWLQGLDLFFSHVDEERQICGISPQTNWHKWKTKSDSRNKDSHLESILRTWDAQPLAFPQEIAPLWFWMVPQIA